MQNIDTIIVVGFQRDSQEPYSKVWKRLERITLEQRATLPVPVLIEGSVLELALDAEVRELRVDHLRWEHVRQTLYVHVVLTESVADSLRTLGFKAWRPWLRRRATESFLERCRRTGWNQRDPAGSKITAPSAGSGRIEPTL